MSEPSNLINGVMHKFRQLNPEGLQTIVALSGGADSVALLFCLSKIKNLSLKAIHITHDIRPESETEIDYQIAKKTAERCRVDFLRIRGPVVSAPKFHEQPFLQDEETNIEAIARHVRYSILAKMSNSRLESKPNQNFIRKDSYPTSSGFIATAHHADDQLETLLMRICRGTGLQGLRGIAEVREDFHNRSPRIIRPMLEVTRKDTEEICKVNNLPWTTDSTNADVKYARNKIRSEVIPVLRQLFPQCAKHASSLAQIASSAQNVIENVSARDIKTNHSQTKTEGIHHCIADTLRSQEDVVIHNWFTNACKIACPNDSIILNKQMMNDVIRIIKNKQTKKLEWGNRIVEISPESVTVLRRREND